MCDAQLVPWESCATTEHTYPVGVDDHIDPSRSAIVGVSGFWICQRFCMLSKMRACIAGGHVLAHDSRGLAARRTCVVVAHDSQGTGCASHMRQHVYASIFARFSMVCTTIDRFKTGGAHNGAARREASPFESSAPTEGAGGDGALPRPLVDYSAMSRYKKVTTCSRVQVSAGENLPGSVPLVMPLATAQATESAK